MTERGVPWRRGRAYGVVLGGLTALALAYLPLALHGRAHSRFDPDAPATLDGEAFFAHAVYDTGNGRLRLADDYRLVQWLRANTASDDVILEAQLPEYRWGSRISSFTGRPTVLGYRYHQSQQRPVPALGEAIALRRRNIEAIYASTDADLALRLLRHYRVRYVIVGGLERASYPARGLAKFAALVESGGLAVAFAAGDDVIYRVVGDPASGMPWSARW